MSWDVGLVDGDLPPVTQHITERELTLQRVEMRLRLFLGEYVLDTRQGLDFLGWVAQKPPRTAEIAAVVRREVETTPGVRRVERWTGSFDPAEQRVTIGGHVITDDGASTALEVALLGRGANRYPFVIFGGSGRIVPARP